MAQTVITRNQFTVPYVQGGRQEVDLGRGNLVREINLRLSATVAATSAASLTRANLSRGDIWDLVDRIEIIANGSTVIRQMTGAQARVICQRTYGGLIDEYPPGSTARIGDTTSTSVALQSTIIIPFWQMQARVPIETVLDTRKMSTFRLAIQWSSSATPWVHTGASVAGAATSGVELQVSSNESWGVEGKFAATRISRLANTVTAAGQFDVRLPVGPIYRRFIINAYNATTNVELPNAIANVELRSGTNIMRQFDWATLTTLASVRTNVVPQQFVSTRHDPRAWAVLDTVQDGLLTEAPDSNGLSELVLRFQMNAACALDVLPDEIIPEGR
jgi:hypothetical protein